VLSLDRAALAEMSIPVGTGWLLGACMEARGKQDLWIRQKPEVLEVLREQAIIQSAESSNRIEGVTVAPHRLRPLVLGNATPRDRSEEEIAGYRHALDWIFSWQRGVPVSPALIQRLHALAQGGVSGDAGAWKERDNEIVEILPSGERTVRFVPTPAKDTPNAVAALCLNYRDIADERRVPPLLVVATFVLDLLCVHPFRDGNGRVSRLAATFLLQSHGFQVVRFVSLERIVEQSKDQYYRALAECSEGWHEGRNTVVPWWNYFLDVLRQAYDQLELQIGSVEARPAKSDLVRQTILIQLGQFTLGDLAAQVPVASPQLIKKVLAEMKQQGKVRLFGRGRGARWEVVS